MLIRSAVIQTSINSHVVHKTVTLDQSVSDFSLIEKYCPELQIISIPLRRKFRGIMQREVAIFKGPEGWSEFGPFLEYDDNESAYWMQAALEAAYEPWPTLHRTKVAINATIPLISPADVAEVLATFRGTSTAKVKIDDFDNGALVVERILEINPEMNIRLDVNAGWSAEDAIRNLGEYSKRFGDRIEYVEQPCKSLPELAEVKRNSDIPIAADESIRKNLDGDFSDFSRYADVAIIKWQPIGGFKAAHELADRIGLPVVISSALETGIGISHGLALAASFANSDRACGLGTVALFEGDICNPPVIAVDGCIQVQRRDPDRYSMFPADSTRTLYWKERIVRVLNILERRRNEFDNARA